MLRLASSVLHVAMASGARPAVFGGRALGVPAVSRVRALHGTASLRFVASATAGGGGAAAALAAVRALDIDALRALEAGSPLEEARLALEAAIRAIEREPVSAAAPPAAADDDAAELERSARLSLAFAHVRLGDSLAAEAQLALLLGTGIAALPKARDLADPDDDAPAPAAGQRLAPPLGEAAALLRPWALREAQFLLGVVYQGGVVRDGAMAASQTRTGREELAVDLLEAVADADDGHWRARFQLGVIAAQWGMHDDAAELLAQVSVLNPGHAQTEAILAKLAQLKEAAALDEAEEAEALRAAAAASAALAADPSLPSAADIMAELDDDEAASMAADEQAAMLAAANGAAEPAGSSEGGAGGGAR